MNAGPTVVGRTAQGLHGYLRAVAAAVGVPAEATSCELTDTTTAYLALTRRHPAYPNRDLMLAWGAGTGWVLAVETEPDETPLVLGYFGATLVPAPTQIAQFITDLLAGTHRGHPEPPHLGPLGPEVLERCLAHYLPSPRTEPVAEEHA